MQATIDSRLREQDAVHEDVVAQWRITVKLRDEAIERLRSELSLEREETRKLRRTEEFQKKLLEQRERSLEETGIKLTEAEAALEKYGVINKKGPSYLKILAAEVKLRKQAEGELALAKRDLVQYELKLKKQSEEHQKSVAESRRTVEELGVKIRELEAKAGDRELAQPRPMEAPSFRLTIAELAEFTRLFAPRASE